jgi:hypothetical protein
LAYHTDTQTSGELNHGVFRFGKNQQKQQRALNLPLLTAKFSDYCHKLLKTSGHDQSKIIIAIDELDKIHDINQVKDLLSDIKGALSLPHVYFILTIAEDCADSFRQRLSHGRDIFESSFDEVFYIDCIDEHCVKQMAANISPKNPLNQQLSLLLFLYSGGVAREVMRGLKAIYSEANDPATCQPLDLATKLMQQAWQGWLMELVSLPIQAHKIKDLYHNGQHALALFNNQAIDTATIDLLEYQIDLSLEIVIKGEDTDDFIWCSKSDLDLDPNPNQAAQQSRAAKLARIECVRSLIKLDILTRLTGQQLSTKGLPAINAYKLIECFKMLEKQPFIARDLLKQLLLNCGDLNNTLIKSPE